MVSPKDQASHVVRWLQKLFLLSLRWQACSLLLPHAGPHRLSLASRQAGPSYQPPCAFCILLQGKVFGLEGFPCSLQRERPRDKGEDYIPLHPAPVLCTVCSGPPRALPGVRHQPNPFPECSICILTMEPHEAQLPFLALFMFVKPGSGSMRLNTMPLLETMLFH